VSRPALTAGGRGRQHEIPGDGVTSRGSAPAARRIPPPR